MTDRRRSIFTLLLTVVLAVSVKNEFFMFLLAFELLIFAAAVVQVIYLSKRVSMRVILPGKQAYRGESFTFMAEMHNSAFLPVPQLLARVAVKDFADSEPMLLRGRLMLSAGETGSLCFTADCAHAACLEISPDMLVITDFLGIVSRRCSVNREEKHLLFVLPDVLTRDISAPGGGGSGGAGIGGDGFNDDGEPGSRRGSSPDVADIGFYQPGDSLRLIHWKLSARMDELMVRRLSEPEGESARIWLDLREKESHTRGDRACWDAFMDTVCSVSAALLAKERSHSVQWWDIQTKAQVQHQVKDEESMNSMLCALLHTQTIPARAGDIRIGKELSDAEDQITIDLSCGIVHTKAG